MQPKKLNKAQTNKLEQQLTQSAIAVMTMPGQSLENLATEFAVLDVNARNAIGSIYQHLLFVSEKIGAMEIPEDNALAKEVRDELKGLILEIANTGSNFSVAAQKLDATQAIDAALQGEGQKSGLIMPGKGLH
ncbi:hypothetical protein [Thalassobius sp. Cn5-15]|uniref:hypothetical protein n=1 Tax=Thalassobius sp. Cn5-15 TaxID=2917763 RepID=UPI001EF24868|nr:hypothetical protein [Thalassobius sp. Cn5-15]MCG7492408.1 hypothetical protein [Thalassobius sp. Cn5-15]